MYDAKRPFHNAVAIDVSATDQTPTLGSSNGVYIGGTGDLVVRLKNASADVTFKSLPVGFADIQVAKVVKTGTTVTNSLLLY